MKTKSLVVSLSVLSLLGAGCEVPTLVRVMGGPQGVPSPGVSAAAGEEELSAAAAKNANANAEILHEILQVVYNREPKDQAEFRSWEGALNQGASFEGVYNGLAHSADYRKLEMSHEGASAEALKVFSEELALLEIELPLETQTMNDPSHHSAQDSTTNMDLARQSPVPGGSNDPSPKRIQALAEKYAKQFVGVSIFTLKRVIGEEALRVIGVKDSYPEQLANWYSKWVIHILQRNVDFGIALRNKPDESFHYKWALSVPEDRLKWEVLNRLHRVMNDANRHKQ